MTDTHPEIEKLVREKLMSLTGGQRMRMGSDMFEAAKRMMYASFPRNLGALDRKRMIYERIYGEKPPF
jgi:hypothetical protein